MTPNAGGTALVYTPTPGFVGIEHLRYVATDNLGGTGTGTVSIIVGRVHAGSDFFALSGNAPGIPVELDVLANDTILPFSANTLALTAIGPGTNSPIGTLQINGTGTRRIFTPSGTTGQFDFDYVVQDSSTPPRTATGRVTLAAVPNGIYASPDRFLVRGGGANYSLNVLANDITYPNLNKSYSILSIGAGANAPSAGGSVRIENNRLVYTPASGFFGEETLTYLMSDSVNTDTAMVTVSVRRGDLVANDDHYTVYHELEGASTNATAFTLPVTLNDRIQHALNQVIQITGVGVGTNAPDQSGEVTVAPDGISLVYRPATVPPSSNYVERFTYEISDGTDRRSSATVKVVVRKRQSKLESFTQDDQFTVSRNSVDNLMPVLRNDSVLPGSAGGWVITSSDSSSAQGGLTTVIGAQAAYTPPENFVGLDAFTYRVSDGLGGTGSAVVRIQVGNIPTLLDRFSVLSGSVSNALDVLANDLLNPAYAEEYELDSVFGATMGGLVSLGASNRVSYTPSPTYVGAYPYEETFFYHVADDASGLVTGTVSVLVHDRTDGLSTTNITVVVQGVNDPPVISGASLVPAINDKQTAYPFTHMLIGEVDEQLMEIIDIEVSLQNPDQGWLISQPGGFADLGGGRYGVSNVTAAIGTAQIRQLVFVPTENRITVPTTEPAYFRVSVTDNKSNPVVDTNSVVWVTATNDAPVLSGTIAGQEFFYLLFSSGTNVVAVGGELATTFRIEVEDGFAGTVRDTNSSVIARNPAGDTVRPLDTLLQGSYGLAVDAIDDFAVVGAPNSTTNGANAGTAFVYRRVPGSTNTWEQWRQLQPSMVNTNDRFGRAVAMSDSFIAVGAIQSETGSVEVGAVYLFGRNSGGQDNWGETNRIVPTGLSTASRFGQSVALEGDLLAVGAPDAILTPGAPTPGAVFVYQRNQGGTNAWGEVFRWSPTETGRDNSRFGWSVALSGDRLVVGAPLFDGTPANGRLEGAAFVFLRDSGGSNTWSQIQKIVSDEPSLSDEFGWDVSLGSNLLAIGAPGMKAGNESEAGRVYLYERGTSNLFDFAEQLDRRNDNERRFGHSLSATDDTLFVGAPENDGPSNRGAAFLFSRNPTNRATWNMVQKLTRPSGSVAGLYGTAVRYTRGTAIVGAPANLSQISNRGFAYLYRFGYNRAPIQRAAIPDQFAEVGVPFSFTVPTGTFIDPDTDDILTYSTDLPAGSNGLQSVAGTVHGTPVSDGMTLITVTATDRAGAETNTTFRLFILSGTNSFGTIRHQWNFDNFGAALLNPGLETSIWGPNANLDADFMSNDREYVFGGDPLVPDAMGLDLQSDGAGNPLIVYTRRANDPGLTFELEGTSDLLIWFDASSLVIAESAVPIAGTDYERVTYLLVLPDGYTVLAFRVRVRY